MFYDCFLSKKMSQIQIYLNWAKIASWKKLLKIHISEMPYMNKYLTLL